MSVSQRQKFTLLIGEVARRTGVATSAIRFHEDKALIRSVRTPGNQRCYAHDARRREPQGAVSASRAYRSLQTPGGRLRPPVPALCLDPSIPYPPRP